MTPLERAHTALALLTVDPLLGGLVIRDRAGPVRDTLTKQLPAHCRLHPSMTAEALDGGVDISATLGSGILTQTRGLLAHDGLFVLAMAERTTPYMAARLATALDAQSGKALIALDEGIDDEAVPATLLDRLAFHVDLESCALTDAAPTFANDSSARLVQIRVPEDTIETLVFLAVRLGIGSLRAAGFALRAAKAHAALNGRQEIHQVDLSVAVELVYAHRATQLPAQEEQSQDTDGPPEPLDADDAGTPPQQRDALPHDILLDAILAALPPDVLARLQSKGKTAKPSGSGAGQRKIGNRRGRPLPARDGNRAIGRVDLIATLRAAVPWQTLRKREQPRRRGPIIRRSDLRFKRYLDLSDRVLIFVVDASGSAAMARMGEAKGAIELLLAEAYARRDHVALIAFRATQADILLEPTRSLVQTKRKLADLPGGGATPLAAGLLGAQQMALHARRKGMTPTIIALTDGRTNMALDGTANRPQAFRDALDIADAIGRHKIDSIVIDTGRRPEPNLAKIADFMDGHYIALPRADARSLSLAVTDTLAT